MQASERAGGRGEEGASLRRKVWRRRTTLTRFLLHSRHVLQGEAVEKSFQPCPFPSSPGVSSRRSPARTAPWPLLPRRRRRPPAPLPPTPFAGARRRCPRWQNRTASRRRITTARKTAAAAVRAGCESWAWSATTGREYPVFLICVSRFRKGGCLGTLAGERERTREGRDGTSEHARASLRRPSKEELAASFFFE